MKNLCILMLFFFSFHFTLNAQHIDNADMEDWATYAQDKEGPIGWITRNQSSNDYSKLFCKKITNSYSGNYAVQIINHKQGNACYSSSLRLGSASGQEGIDFTLRPSGLAFYYTYTGIHEAVPLTIGTPMVGKVQIQLSRRNPATNEKIIVGEGIRYFGAQDNTDEFVLAEIPIEYFSDDNPEKLEISFKNPCDNYDPTQFTIDFVGLTGLVATNTEELTLLNEVEVYPTPTAGLLTFKSILDHPKASLIKIVDIRGKQIEELAFIGNEKVINTSSWANGLYFYQVFQDGNFLKSGKIIVSK